MEERLKKVIKTFDCFYRPVVGDLNATLVCLYIYIYINIYYIYN